MARSNRQLVHIGIKNLVIAFDRKTGAEIWRTALPARYKSSGTFVNIVRDGEALFATSAGELFALDAASGALRWHQPLKGLGTGLVSIAAGDTTNSAHLLVTEMERQRRAAAAAAAAS